MKFIALPMANGIGRHLVNLDLVTHITEASDGSSLFHFSYDFENDMPFHSVFSFDDTLVAVNAEQGVLRGQLSTKEKTK